MISIDFLLLPIRDLEGFKTWSNPFNRQIYFRRPASGLALPLNDTSSGSNSAQNRQKSVDTMDPSTIAEAKAMQLRQPGQSLHQVPRFEKRANSINQAPVRISQKLTVLKFAISNSVFLHLLLFKLPDLNLFSIMEWDSNPQYVLWGGAMYFMCSFIKYLTFPA